MTEATANIDLEPQGPSDSGPYFLYTRKKDGLWTSINMLIFYIVLIGLALWSEEYVLLGFTVLLALWLIYDQVTNPQFVEIDADYLRYRLPRKVEGEIALNDIRAAEMSPDQLRLDLVDGTAVVLEINALLARKKRVELRKHLKDQIEGLQEVER